jgi:hypothetical protein
MYSVPSIVNGKSLFTLLHLADPCFAGYMQHEDLWNMVCEALMMTDVMNMGRTCHAMRHLCDLLARRRLRQILEPWTGRHFQLFLDFLRDEGCIVTGSCALAMLMGGELSNARDLNLVGRPESFSVCDKFIQETMGYVTISEICHQALTRVVGRFRKYRRNEHIITLSLPKEGLHILHVILYAPSTIDMIYMTGGGLSTFYLELLLKGVTVHGHSAPHVPWGDKLGHVGHNDHNWTVARHTQFLCGPCHDLCPTLWNHIASGKHQLMVDWDRSRTIRNVALNTDIEWRLNSYCVNDRCPYYIATMAGNFEGCGASSGTLSALPWSCCA